MLTRRCRAINTIFIESGLHIIRKMEYLGYYYSCIGLLGFDTARYVDIDFA